MEQLEQCVIAENEKQLQRTIEEITKEKNMYTIKYYLTDLRAKQLADGTITEDKAIEIATKKATKEYKRRLDRDLKRIEDVEKAEDITNIRIVVEWSKQGHAHAEVWALGYTEGGAYGYGYDKQSSAIADAFNKNNAILKLIYTLKNEKLKENVNISSHEAIGYGAGYGALPYFEGGVGTNCFICIFKALGFTCEELHSKNADGYIIKK